MTILCFLDSIKYIIKFLVSQFGMEYPGTKFTRPVRITMLFFFIAAFFIISPIIIMYTAGYRYDWQNGLLKETGAISIDIEPKNATVYLNGIKLQDKMPIRLNNIAPAKYNLRIAAAGYFDWLKEIEVKNKQTNYIKEITLIKKNKPQILLSEKIKTMSLSSDGRFIIYQTQKTSKAKPSTEPQSGSSTRDNTQEIWLWNNNNKKSIILFRLNGAEPITINWAEKNNYAVIADLAVPHRRLIVINAANPSKQIDLAKKNPAIKKFQWENSTEPQLYYSTEQNIFLYSPVTEKHQPVVKNKYLDWRMENGQLWTMQTDSTTKQYQITKDALGFNSSFNTLNTNNINLATGQTEKESWQMLSARQNVVLLKNEKKTEMLLLTNTGQYRLAAEKFLISRHNNWWLLWSPWELWTYSAGEEPYLLNRSGEHLREVAPLDKYNTLALSWAEKITVSFPYYLVTHDLLDEKIKDMAVDMENKILYFINQNESKAGIWKLNY